MAVVYDLMRRLEAGPRLEDLARVFKAETADPVWFLGRQWQLGEHLGEDASSPVRIEYRPTLVPVDPLGGDRRMDPRTTPAEAIVESEPEDFWTPGRRVAAGRRGAAALAPPRPPPPAGPPPPSPPPAAACPVTRNCSCPACPCPTTRSTAPGPTAVPCGAG